MANIKQQIKRNRTNEKSRVLNQSLKSSVKTAIKQVASAIEENNKELANEKLVVAFRKLDKAQARGIFHKNYVARNKSSLQTKVNAIN